MSAEAPTKNGPEDHSHRFLTIYHILVTIVTLLSGGSLFAFGIWLHATDNGLPFNLHHDGDSWYGPFVRFGQGFMIVGALLLLTGVLALAALGRRRHADGYVFGVLYCVLALLIVAALAVACAVSTLVIVRGSDEATRDVLRSAWLRTASVQPAEICAIEAHFQCRGFDEGACVSCPTGLESACADVPQCTACGSGERSGAATVAGCYEEIVSSSKSIFRPAAIGTGVVAGVVLVDVFVSCLV